MRTVSASFQSPLTMLIFYKMISEIIRDKKYQSRAFLLLPMTFNIGVIIGMAFTMFIRLYPYLTVCSFRRSDTWWFFSRSSRQLSCLFWLNRMVETVAICTSEPCQFCISLPVGNGRAARTRRGNQRSINNSLRPYTDLSTVPRDVER